MWQDYVSGRLPQPDLRNLDAEADEVQTIADYLGFWQAPLTKLATIRPLPYDNRLWTQAS
jgi:hypothetical protein